MIGHKLVSSQDFRIIGIIHDDLSTSIGNVKRQNPNTKILLSEITPRNDAFDREVMQLNALLFNSVRLDDTVYLARHSNMRRSEYFHDNKHTERNHVNRLAGNIRFSLRRLWELK